MKYFYGLVRQDGDSAFGVEFPDLPGCFSASDDADGIVANAIEALELWFEDMPDVEPRSIADLLAEARDVIAEGGFFVRVPFIGSAGKSQRVNITIDGAVLAAVDRAASERQVTRSAFLAEAARREIERTA